VDLSIFFAGTAGSVPTARRNLPAFLVRRGGDRILIDCGEGTQRQLLRSVGLADVDDIFITHFHLDHWLGLPGLLKTFDLRDRDRPLAVHGPRGLRALMEGLRPLYGRLSYELQVHDLEADAVVRRDGYSIAPVAVRHRGPAYGYVLWEEERPGAFDAAEAERLGVTPGPDFGRLQHGETVGGVEPGQVLGPARLGRKLVFSGDTAPSEALALAAHGADVLVHEATFSDEERARAADTMHSTARQAAELARDADVHLLALTHLSPRYFGPEIVREARDVFANTVVPRDFDVIEVPFAERGEPRLVKGGALPVRDEDKVPAT
jgi:ribonuclease Z